MHYYTSSNIFPHLSSHLDLSVSSIRLLSYFYASIALSLIAVQIIATAITESHSNSESPDRIYSTSSIGGGIWAGLFYLGTAFVGLLTVRIKSNFYLISYLCLSIIAICPMSILTAAATSYDVSEREYQYCNHRLEGGPCSKYFKLMVVLNVIMLIKSFAIMGASIVSIVISAKALHKGQGCACCCLCCHEPEIQPQLRNSVLIYSQRTGIHGYPFATANNIPVVQTDVLANSNLVHGYQLNSGGQVSLSDHFTDVKDAPSKFYNSNFEVLPSDDGSASSTNYLCDNFQSDDPMSSARASNNFTSDNINSFPTVPAVFPNDGMIFINASQHRLFATQSPPPSYEYASNPH